jgi:hypothetical protein
VIDVGAGLGWFDALTMYDRYDRSRSRASGNVNGAMRGGSDGHRREKRKTRSD